MTSIDNVASVGGLLIDMEIEIHRLGTLVSMLNQFLRLGCSSESEPAVHLLVDELLNSAKRTDETYYKLHEAIVRERRQ